MKRKLFRYRSFDNEIVNDYSYIHQRMVNVEKWKFEAFEGLVYPSSPLYFNDPYDCEFCFQADTIDELLDRKEYIQKKDIQHLNAICRIQMGNGYIKQFVENLMYGPMKKSGVL